MTYKFRLSGYSWKDDAALMEKVFPLDSAAISFDDIWRAYGRATNPGGLPDYGEVALWLVRLVEAGKVRICKDGGS